MPAQVSWPLTMQSENRTNKDKLLQRSLQNVALSLQNAIMSSLQQAALLPSTGPSHIAAKTRSLVNTQSTWVRALNAVHVTDNYQTVKYTDCLTVGIARLATAWTVRGSNPGGGEVFRTRPYRPCDPPSLLYNGHRVFPGGKSAGRWC